MLLYSLEIFFISFSLLIDVLDIFFFQFVIENSLNFILIVCLLLNIFKNLFPLIKLRLAVELLHCFFEFLAPTLIEIFQTPDYFIWDIGKIKKDHDKIWLFISPLLLFFYNLFSIWINDFFSTILYELISIFNSCWHIHKFSRIVHIWQNWVPWWALNCFTLNCCFFKFCNCITIIEAESIILSHVLLFSQDFISLRKLNTLEEVWKVFIYLNIFFLHSKAKFL